MLLLFVQRSFIVHDFTDNNVGLFGHLTISFLQKMIMCIVYMVNAKICIS